MKSFHFWLILVGIVLVVVSCTSASKYLQRGRYDDAITKSISDLKKNPADEESLGILRDAYRLADLNDKERLASLEAQNYPEIWDGVITIYQTMIARNKRMEELPSSVKNTVNFQYESYENQLNDAKHKAADYHYGIALKRMEQHTTAEYRAAYNDFNKVIQYVGSNYKDVAELQAEAREKGTVYVCYTVDNRSGHSIPNEAIYNFGDIDPQTLNSSWVKYEVGCDRESSQYQITYTLDRCNIFQPKSEIRQKSYSKEIQDGTEYKTDENGKPVLDASGNFIKIPKIVHISCNVVEVIQRKSIQIGGVLTFINVENNYRVMRTLPITRSTSVARSTFDIKGDTRAIPADVQKRISKPSFPMPVDNDLMITASQDMVGHIRQSIRNNAYLFK
ncbi:MAG: hypothetical protein LBU91_03475 [Bacteroidales bacterium]|jgi:hypothetical protein|nr:hypothetical protein [Bacteroidales bacterium]